MKLSSLILRAAVLSGLGLLAAQSSVTAGGCFEINYTHPIPQAVMVSPNTTIRIGFSQAMQIATLDASTITVTGSSSGDCAGTFGYSADQTMVTFDPQQDFLLGEAVSVFISTNVLAQDGSTLDRPYQFSFRVMAAVPVPIAVSGTLASNVSWTSGNVYSVNSLTIPAGSTLTIQQSVVVKFGQDRALSVQGGLVLQSTPSEPVVFTSYKDDEYGGDSNGDGPSAGAPGDWAYLSYSSPTNVFHDALVRFGGYKDSLPPGDWGLVEVACPAQGSVIEIRDCVMEESKHPGLNVRSGQMPWIHDCVIRKCAREYAVKTAVGVRLERNRVSGCNGGFRLEGGTSVVTSNLVTGNGYPVYQAGTDPIYVGNRFECNQWSVIGVGGTLEATNTVWEKMPDQGLSTYLVVSSVAVPAGKTLTLDPGLVVKFAAQQGLGISGKLLLQSTPSERAVFTSYKDDDYGGDSNGDGPSAGGAGDWAYLWYYNPTNVLHDALVRYGGYNTFSSGDWGMVGVSCPANGSIIEIRDCVLEESRRDGLEVRSGQMPWVHDCVIRDCDYGGYAGVKTDVGARIERNTISNCNWGLRLLGGTSLVTSNLVTGNMYAAYQGGTDPVYSANRFVGNQWQVMGVGGSLLGTSTFWERLCCQGLDAYLVISGMTVPAGSTLTLDEGLVVKFMEGQLLAVRGDLLLQSTPLERVVFTSYRDDEHGGDSNGDGPSAGTAGDWLYLWYYNPANFLHDALVRYGGSSYGLVGVESTAPGAFLARNVRFHASATAGLYCSDADVSALVYHCEFTSMATRGIDLRGGQLAAERDTFAEYGVAAVYVSGTGQAAIHQSNFVDPQLDYGVRNDTAVNVDARSNWWAHASGPGTVGPGSGVKVSTNVVFADWSTNYIPIVPLAGPKIISSPNTYAVLEEPYQYDADRYAQAVGDGQILWTKLRGPDGFSIHPVTGEITWTPTHIGTYLIVIQATDTNGVDAQIFRAFVDTSQDLEAPHVAGFSYVLTAITPAAEAKLLVRFTEPVLVDLSDVAILDEAWNLVPFRDLDYLVNENLLTITVPGLTLDKTYRLFLTDTITDEAGNWLNGDFNGYAFPSGNLAPGGDFSVYFTVTDLGSLRMEAWRELSVDAVRLRVHGVAGSYRILTSTNLSSWIPWFEGYSANPMVEMTDPEAGQRPHRFYRALAP